MTKFGLFTLVIALLTSLASCDKAEDPEASIVVTGSGLGSGSSEPLEGSMSATYTIGE